jgi:hypothetical protein
MRRKAAVVAKRLDLSKNSVLEIMKRHRHADTAQAVPPISTTLTDVIVPCRAQVVFATVPCRLTRSLAKGEYG